MLYKLIEVKDCPVFMRMTMAQITNRKQISLDDVRRVE